MKIPRPYSLQSKFLLGLTGSILLVSAIIISLFYFFMKSTLDEEVSIKATIILEQVDAVQSYVRQVLRPRMYDMLSDTFVVEAMSSSFISRSVMEKNSGQDSDYIYRRVAVNARNPRFEANTLELELVDYFRNNTDKDLWEGYRRIDGRQVFVMARPVKFIASCMHCHGSPDDAPKELIEKYGDRGFGHVVNRIDGVDLVGVPTQQYATQSSARLMLYVFTYLAVSAVVLFLTYLTFRQVVIVNFKTLTNQFRKNFRDQKTSELLSKVEHGDEIEEMIEGMEGLSRHLYETEQQLKAYNADLEREVERRTDQLTRENVNHKKDLELFVSILRSLRGSLNRPQLWATVLPLLARRFDLIRAVYICTFSSNQTFAWPKSADRFSLPDDHVEMLISPGIRFRANGAYIPVGSSLDNIEGLLYLEKPENEEFSGKYTELLMAVGRQLGIAAENLAALDSILRQSRDLQTIFDGILDPLLLIDRNGALILANKAAAQLAEELSCAEENLIECLYSSCCRETGGADWKRRLSTAETREVFLENGRSFNVNSLPLVAEELSVDRLIITVSETTERKKMLQQVVRSEKMATVGKLAAGLAHELNNPMGVILCYAELLQKSLKEPQQQSDIDVVIKHTKQAQSVLLNLLNFARPKVTTDHLTSIEDVVAGLISVFQVQASKKGVRLNLETGDNLPPVYVEPQAVEHIVLNLLLNSLDAVAENRGEITVGVHADKDGLAVVLTVRDNGDGIGPDVLPFIFDPFFTTKEVNEGTGLGLAMVYGYVEELGGRIEATSTPEMGTLFEVVFPVGKRS